MSETDEAETLVVEEVLMDLQPLIVEGVTAEQADTATDFIGNLLELAPCRNRVFDSSGQATAYQRNLAAMLRGVFLQSDAIGEALTQASLASILFGQVEFIRGLSRP